MDEMLECNNCGRIACTDCVDDAEKSDQRDCDCDHLCQECRDGPDKCKTCLTSGCCLCMGNGCVICSESKKHRSELVCQDCQISCGMCNKELCVEHIYRCTGGDESDDESRHYKICTLCINETFNLRRKGKRSLDSTDELTSAEAK